MITARHVLTTDELDELLYLRACGFTQRELARCFFVHQTTIGCYLRRIGDPLERTPRYRSDRWKEAA